MIHRRMSLRFNHRHSMVEIVSVSSIVSPLFWSFISVLRMGFHVLNLLFYTSYFSKFACICMLVFLLSYIITYIWRMVFLFDIVLSVSKIHSQSLWSKMNKKINSETLPQSLLRMFEIILLLSHLTREYEEKLLSTFVFRIQFYIYMYVAFLVWFSIFSLVRTLLQKEYDIIIGNNLDSVYK